MGHSVIRLYVVLEITRCKRCTSDKIRQIRLLNCIIETIHIFYLLSTLIILLRTINDHKRFRGIIAIIFWNIISVLTVVIIVWNVRNEIEWKTPRHGVSCYNIVFYLQGREMNRTVRYWPNIGISYYRKVIIIHICLCTAPQSWLMFDRRKLPYHKS